jgi:diacylglycerol O-acyltransferase / wax synthase
MTSIHRLSADDSVMLWPDAIWPQEVAALAILDGAGLLDGDGNLRLETVRATVGSRLHLVPRLGQLLHRPRRGLGGPLWVDAPTFDVTQHVLTVPVPPPGDEAALLSTVEQLRRRRLDRSRPLWLMCVLTGLPGQRLGLFVKLHHALADGVAALATIGAFLDGAPPRPTAIPLRSATPGPTVTPAPPRRPEPLPTAVQLLTNNARQHVMGFGRAMATLAHPLTTARRLAAAYSQLRTFSGGPPDPPSSLDHPLSADRRLAFVRASLDQVAVTAHAHHATVNDVLLAAAAAGLRALLLARGEPVDHPVNIDVPITLRPKEGRDRARGNRIAQMLIALPVNESDPRRRLELIAAQTATRKQEPHPPAGRLLGSRLVRRFVLNALRRHPVNVTSADLTGPPEPVYLAGARILEAFPVLPLMGNVCLGIGALSYAGQFTVGVISDLYAYPDLDLFISALRTELSALPGAASSRTVADNGPLVVGTGQAGICRGWASEAAESHAVSGLAPVASLCAQAAG